MGEVSCIKRFALLRGVCALVRLPLGVVVLCFWSDGARVSSFMYNGSAHSVYVQWEGIVLYFASRSNIHLFANPVSVYCGWPGAAGVEDRVGEMLTWSLLRGGHLISFKVS